MWNQQAAKKRGAYGGADDAENAVSVRVAGRIVVLNTDTTVEKISVVGKAASTFDAVRAGHSWTKGRKHSFLLKNGFKVL